MAETAGDVAGAITSVSVTAFTQVLRVRSTSGEFNLCDIRRPAGTSALTGGGAP